MLKSKYIQLALAIYVLVVVPSSLVVLGIVYSLAPELVNSVLLYIGAIVGTPAGLYSFGVGKGKSTDV